MKGKNVTIDEAREIVRTASFKTILEKNDRYSEHRPVVIAFASEGTKYLYGIPCYKNDGGELEHCYWVGSFEKANIKVFDGQRWDLVDAYHEYLTRKDAYEKARKNYRWQVQSDLNRKAREEEDRIMAVWDAANPEPKNPFENPP